MRTSMREAGAVVAVVAIALLTGMAGSASAAEPWWHIATISAPAGPNTDGQARVDLDIADLGDAATTGTYLENLGEAMRGESRNFVIVEDVLPAGVTPTDVHAEGGGTNFGSVSEFEIERELGRNLCTVTGQSIRCEYATPVRPYEQIIVAITVLVEPGAGTGENSATVSGGGAPSIHSRHRLALEKTDAYGVQTLEMKPEEEQGLPATQAGSHPYQLTTTLMLNTQTQEVVNSGHSPYLEVTPLALTKDVNISLPPGLVGNPTQVPKCNIHTFLQSVTTEREPGTPECPNDTVVGVASPIITSLHLLGKFFVPYPTVYPIVNLEPSIGEPARFGFGTPLGPIVVDTSVRTGSDYAVIASVHNALSNAPFIGSIVSFWGTPGDARHDNSRNRQCLEDTAAQEMPSTPGPEPSCPAQEENPPPFLTMPTSCESPLQASAEVDSWAQIGKFTQPFVYPFQNDDGETYPLDGCNRLNFEPSISVVPDGEEASTPTGLSVDVHVPQEASLTATGLAESAVRETTVTLPEGVALNPSGADGLLACSEEQVGLKSALEQSCPEASKVGTVEIHTPLLPASQPLIGAAYVAQQEANPFGSLIAMYLIAKDPISGVITKLAGEVKADPNTGQLVATFKDVPPLPFEDAKIHFFGGSRGPLGTPALCGIYASTSSIVPWSGNGSVASSSQFAIASGPNHTPCSDPLPFAPTLTAGSVNLQAGAFTPFTMTMSREDGNQDLQAVQLRMPEGLSGLLTGVKLCAEAQANAGTCGPESLIGETTVSVGLGGNPYSVEGGRVYITGPYEGAPFGLSIVNPAKAGPFDLEKDTPCDCVIVRARIEVDPITAALTVTTDTAGPYAIPQILDGIPLQIKHVNVVVSRPGFTFNPTNCAPMSVRGRLTSTQGATSALDVPFQVANCATLGFKPNFSVSTSGKASKTKGASLHVKLAYPKAPFGSQANIKSVKVSLPKQLPSRLSTLQRACPAAKFETNPAECPPESRVGSAKATTPLLPVLLSGPAYFVSYGGLKFPELVVVLQGYGVTLDLHGETFINEKTNVTSSTFRSVPDAPVGTFELTLPQGKFSALAANRNLCTQKLTMPTMFNAQNGMRIKQSTRIAVKGCPKHKHKKFGRRKGAHRKKK